MVCVCVRNGDVSCKNGWIDRDAVGLVGLGGPSNHVLDGVPDPRRGRGNFGVGKGLFPICNRMYTQWHTVVCLCP